MNDIPELDMEKFRMFRLLDLEDHYLRSADHAIILNGIDFNQGDYADVIRQHIYFEGGDVDFIPRCDCGEMTGTYYSGTQCPTCKTVVQSTVLFGEGQIPHKVWLSIPPTVGCGVLHPQCYSVLRRLMNYSKTDSYIDVICDPSINDQTALNALNKMGITGRGLKYFEENFDFIVEIFLSAQKEAPAEEFRRFVKVYRKTMFTRYLPVLSSALHAVTSADGTSSGTRRYADKESQFILESAHTLSFITHGAVVTKRWNVDSRVYSAYRSYIKYLNAIATRRLSKKPSIPRRHVHGSRYHWSFRGVIVPITGPHSYDELYIPWMIGVGTFRVHILGQLINYHDMSMVDAVRKYQRALVTYDDDIYRILNKLIKDSPSKGIPTLFNRNPSIQRGATQLFYITKFKPDPEDRSIALSTLALARPNADFDGDELNGLILLEFDMVKYFERMHTSQMYLSTTSPSTGTDVSLPKQATLLLDQFLAG